MASVQTLRWLNALCWILCVSCAAVPESVSVDVVSKSGAAPGAQLHALWRLYDPAQPEMEQCSESFDDLAAGRVGCYLLPRAGDSAQPDQLALVAFDSSHVVDEEIGGAQAPIVFVAFAAVPLFELAITATTAVALVVYMDSQDMFDPAQELISEMIRPGDWWGAWTAAVSQSGNLAQVQADATTCDDRPGRHYTGPSNCLPLGPATQRIVDRLYTLWGTEPSFLCQYGGMYYPGWNPLIPAVSACGPARPLNAGYCPLDANRTPYGSISFDANLWAGELGAAASFVPSMILAHEWGHLNHHNAGMSWHRDEIRRGYERDADCQSGVFAAHELKAGRLNSLNIGEAFMAACRSGSLASFVFKGTAWDVNPHADCATRMQDFQRGFQWGSTHIEELCGAEAPAQVAQQGCGLLVR